MTGSACQFREVFMVVNGSDIVDKNLDRQACQFNVFFNNLGQDECAGLAFKSCTIPNLFDNVIATNNRLRFSYNNVEYTATIPIGHYTLATLGLMIQNNVNVAIGGPVLSPYNPTDPDPDFTYIDRNTGKFGFRTEGPISFASQVNGSTIWNVIGHSITGDQNVLTAGTFTFINQPQLNWLNTIYITCDRLTPATGFDSAQNTLNLLETMSLSYVPYNTVAYKEANLIYDINFPEPRHTNGFVLTFRDKFLNELYLDQASIYNINLQIRLRVF